MRRMSFSATTEQMRDRTKTVTRRNPETWRQLTPGARLIAVEKAMGLKAGEKQKVLGIIEIVSNRIVFLGEVDDDEARREGFATADEFFRTWVKLHGASDAGDKVRRIEFRHEGSA